MASSSYLVGTCHQMCPEKEIKFRERNNLLHYFEIDHTTKGNAKADPKKIIKQFSRSAAGKAHQSPCDLRPSDILLSTVNYLMNEIIPNDKLPFPSIYDFINDRLQAVRQDITYQMIQDDNSVKIFEKCVRFYITSSYILCDATQFKFDPHLNDQQLSICIEKLFVLYKTFESEHTAEFIGIYLSRNLIYSDVYYRSITVFSNYMFEEDVRISMAACVAYINRNFIRFFKLVEKLPLTLLLCFFQHFPKMREEALKSVNVAFSSPACKFPVEVLSSWLNVSKIDNVLLLCEIYGVKVESNNVCFNKKMFNTTSDCKIIRKEEFINSKLEKVSLSKLINGFC